MGVSIPVLKGRVRVQSWRGQGGLGERPEVVKDTAETKKEKY